MALDGTEKLYLERQVTLGRAILAALSLMALLETSGPSLRKASVIFLAAYLLLALGALYGAELVQRQASASAENQTFGNGMIAGKAVLGSILTMEPFWGG